MNIRPAGLMIGQQRKNQLQLNQSFAKLGSGLQITRAADDAAGLAISEKMRALIRGAEQASRNIQDGASMLQAAEGGMEEISEMLQRMRELTVQASNDTLTSRDRQLIDEEIKQLNQGIRNTILHTEFNTQQVLSNTEEATYAYEERSASIVSHVGSVSQSHSLVTDYNKVGWNSSQREVVTSNERGVTRPSTLSSTDAPFSYKVSTVVDHEPRWSNDGKSIIFQSTRDGGEYVVAADGSADPKENTTGLASRGQQVYTDNNTVRLSQSGDTLRLQERTASGYWSTISHFSYNSSTDSNRGYSFSPRIDGSNQTSFVYSDSDGNLQRVDLDLNTREITGTEQLITTNDRLNLPPENNTITLQDTPDLYRMNTGETSLQVEKHTDSGKEVLTYWDGNGSPPDGGYYTVSGRDITFHDKAVIGNEPIDDAQDYYHVSYVSSSNPKPEAHVTSLSSSAEIYNMDGSDGPRSLRIMVGGREVSREDLLDTVPTDPTTADGVYVNTGSGQVEFYGSWRPAHNESVTVEYLRDMDGRNGIHSYDIPSDIDTYNLDEPDGPRSLRVYVGGTEVEYSDTDGYTFNSTSGEISLHGNARPDVAAGEEVRYEYVRDRQDYLTTEEVYGISLGSTYPEVYNLDGNGPSSIVVLKNGTERVPYSYVNGFQYNEDSNVIELYGDHRPDVNDTYEIRMTAAGSISRQDEVVEVDLMRTPETYGVEDDNIPSTFDVKVDGVTIDYDPTKQNGYVYNSATERIEIYGDARPDASNSGTTNVRVEYVYENPRVVLRPDTYDFRVPTDTLNYGLGEEDGPVSAVVTYKGVEIPYDEESGFTLDIGTGKLSLHGDYRPTNADNAGDYRFYTLRQNAIEMSVPPGAQVYKVEWNGEDVPEVKNGHGYQVNENNVKLVGDARPNVTPSLSRTEMEVFYHDSTDVPLDISPMTMDMKVDCEKNNVSHLFSEVDPDAIEVKLNGETLATDQFSLAGGKIDIHDELVNLQLGDNSIEVDYRIRHVTGYESNSYTYQVGAGQGDQYQVDIASFNNLLLDTDQLCVTSVDTAQQSLGVIDEALTFVNGERSSIGAAQNRMEAMKSVADTVAETTSQSESQIRDVDMAKEIMKMTRANLLSQTTQSMIVQANQQAQSVLQLLK
ncbi:flagellin N-terminal helical domain-containing protein [Alteribacillus iranensis]|nr:flagellin [Alteribacillus iranensis]